MRTLLNWINENLPEEDAKLIAQKVEGSELAKALKAQIEEVLHLKQLPAPEMLDGTPLGNANSSADYLDNAMKPELTPDYEKFCLHSEIRLGEVAACHRILSKALNATLDFSPELRARLLSLSQFADANDEFSIPAMKFVDKIEMNFDDILELEPEPEESKAAVSAERTERISEMPVPAPSDALLPQPNYWKWAMLTCCGLFALFVLIGCVSSGSIPGRMLHILLGGE